MILSFTSSKGGVGKSTCCAAIACALAAEGPVLILDLDPNKTLANWHRKSRYNNITVQYCTTALFAQAFRDALAANTYEHILIDLAGFLHADIMRAFARSDLVVIPATASLPDLMEAMKTMQHVKNVSETLERPILNRLLLTRLPATQNKVRQYIEEQIVSHSVPHFSVGMVERIAYKELYITGLAPHALDSKAAYEINSIIDEIKSIVVAKSNPGIRGAA